MNPGPAPLPPTDRPRINIPSTPTVATNFSQMSLNSPSTPSSESLSLFPNTSTLSLSQIKPQNGSSAVSVIKEGYVRCKEDKFLATWNQRYLILREFRLDFLKNETGKLILSIPLAHVTGVGRSEDTKMAFEVSRLSNPKDAGSKAALLTRDVPIKTITCEVKSDEEIYEWIENIYARCPGMGGVSNPTNFSHRVHVGFDPKTGAFVGLPPEWEKLLSTSAITKEDYKKNPQAVIEALEFYSKREQEPQYYTGSSSSISSSSPARSLGNTSVGSSVAPPRPPHPSQLQRLDNGPLSQNHNSQFVDAPMRPETSSMGFSQQKSFESDRAYEQQQQLEKMKELAEQERRRVEEERQRLRERQQAEDEQNRLDLEAYNASIPKNKVPLAKQELGGYGGSDDSMANRYKPSRPAPQAPGSGARAQQSLDSQSQPRQLVAQRPAPSAPNAGK